MAIKLYHDAECTIEVNSNNPITTEHTIEGESVTVQKYIKNNNELKYYKDVVIKPQGDNASFIQLSLDGEVFSSSGESVTIDDFGELENPDTDARSIWIKITTPAFEDTINLTNTIINIKAREYSVS